ncbi:MAG TPA: VOC family protein, partial [Rugosimonospora sp.]
EATGPGAVMTAEPPPVADRVPDPTALSDPTALPNPTALPHSTALPDPTALPDLDLATGVEPATSPTSGAAPAATGATTTGTTTTGSGTTATTTGTTTTGSGTTATTTGATTTGSGTTGATTTGAETTGTGTTGAPMSAAAGAASEAARQAATKAPPTAPGRRGTALRVEHVLSAEPAVPAMPRSSVVGDLAEDGEISDAYLAVTPPPGQPEPSGVRGVSVTLFVSHLGRSVAFYRDTLGFIQVDMGLGSAVLESGDCRIELRRVIDMEPVDRRLVHLMLEVPDVHGAYEDLRARGMEFVHRPRAVSRYDQLELWSAAFRDPDGHGIALIRWDLR